MTTHEAIAAYYRHPAVQSRIAEYCGGHECYPARFSAVGLAGFGGVRELRQADMAPVPVHSPGLRRLLEDGADVCRSLADRSGTLIQLDVDYVNPDDPAEPNRDPWTCFERIEPVYRAVVDTLAGFGVTPLVLMTGRGYHFTVRAPVGAPLHSELISIGSLSPALRAHYEAEEVDEPLAVSMGWAHEGAGRLVEYLAHDVMRAVRGTTVIPVTAADVPPPGRGPFICLDLTAYGDPVSSRYARCAFSSHQKAAAAPLGTEPPFAPEDFSWILERLPREGTGVCVDTSHCALAGGLLGAIAESASRLVHVQASDNRGHTDDHLPPGSGVIDWGAVDQALGAVGYRGVFMLEVTGEGGVEACLSGLDMWKVNA